MDGYDVVGHLELSTLTNKFGTIYTDEVILMEERRVHIQESHPLDYDYFLDNRSLVISDPDLILVDESNKGTIFVIRGIKDSNNLNILIRLAITGDNPEYKNSIMTSYRINDTKLQKFKGKHELLFERTSK